jgi:hypothetical protein
MKAADDASDLPRLSRGNFTANLLVTRAGGGLSGVVRSRRFPPNFG